MLELFVVGPSLPTPRVGTRSGKLLRTLQEFWHGILDGKASVNHILRLNFVLVGRRTCSFAVYRRNDVLERTP